MKFELDADALVPIVLAICLGISIYSISTCMIADFKIKPPFAEGKQNPEPSPGSEK